MSPLPLSFGPLDLFFGIPFYTSGAIAAVSAVYLFQRMGHPYSIIPYFAAILCFQGVWVFSFCSIYGIGYLAWSFVDLFIPAPKTKKEKK